MQQTVITMLPGGKRVCIHYFVTDEKGPAQTPSRVQPTAIGPVRIGGIRGYIACMPQRDSVTPAAEGNRVRPCAHSNEARAVTCPRCMQTREYQDTMKRLAELTDEVPEESTEG